VDRSCGTHVHVSPEGRFMWEYPYTLDELKCIAKAVIYYDPAVTLILPSERKACSYSRSNVLENAQLKGVYNAVRTYGYGYIFGWIDSFPDHETISSVVSCTKFVAWNFQNAVSGGCGTVEFRRPPQVTTAEATKHWIAFTLCFIKGSLDCDFSQMSHLTTEPGLIELRSIIISAANELGFQVSAALNPLIEVL
jgi:hypothetical protein